MFLTTFTAASLVRTRYTATGEGAGATRRVSRADECECKGADADRGTRPVADVDDGVGAALRGVRTAEFATTEARPRISNALCLSEIVRSLSGELGSAVPLRSVIRDFDP